MTDPERFAWLNGDTRRLQYVYWHIENYGGTVQEAIDALAKMPEGL